MMQYKQPKRFLQCKTLYTVSPILLQLAHTMKQAQEQTLYFVTLGLQLVSLFTGMWELYIVNLRVRGEGAYKPNAQMAKAYPGFLSMKHAQEYYYSPLDAMLAHCRITTQQYAAGTHLYTWVKWSKVPCLRKQHNG